MPCTVPVALRCRRIFEKGLNIHRGYGLPKSPSASSLSSLENVAARTVYGARPLPWLTCPVDRVLERLGLFTRSRESEQPRLKVSSIMKNKERINLSLF